MVQWRSLADGVKVSLGEHALRLSDRGLCCSLRQGPQFYRRTLNGHWFQVDTGRRRLADDEVERLLARVREHCQRLLESLPDDALREPLERAIHADYRADAERYQQIYPEDVPILPPDRYRDLVVQPATGCPNRRCHFCAFYRDRPFALLSEEAFQQQLLAIKGWLGEGVRQRNGVFLGSANALALSQRRLLGVLEHTRQLFGQLPRGVASFWDPDFSPSRSANQWRELQQAGLKRLVVGVETGDGGLRRELGKGDDTERLTEALTVASQAGIPLGICILVGAGGEQLSDRHLENTLRWITALPLGRQDLVYLSPLQNLDTGQASPRPLSDWLAAEQASFKRQLTHYSNAQVTDYRMEDYGYYS
ncbi:radical SAM protein [Aestuariirhabdus litorea]|nr:radical SAM protein [Aestuariirhabdus litorea]